MRERKTWDQENSGYSPGERQRGVPDEGKSPGAGCTRPGGWPDTGEQGWRTPQGTHPRKPEWMEHSICSDTARRHSGLKRAWDDFFFFF